MARLRSPDCREVMSKRWWVRRIAAPTILHSWHVVLFVWVKESFEVHIILYLVGVYAGINRSFYVFPSPFVFLPVGR